ncbi:hypothetical protein Rumeso_01601 [Rubellimicrobium mesophilum DSM 19309]|uniref:Yip1 domain-containing protein n=1 Tax=Rubellimicrobium mesophilum DSM 19309 TaxID=442562 RepID=A0A017HR71_9RHOB|nr:hypothetical protein [Rubellimicrobium mesophilum]EYD76643.1 hypothetical protein Rumeso_01601 [Rubellimicrobium mesophilum DSM 19309]
MPPDATLIGLMRDTVTTPRQTAAHLLGLGLPRRVLFEAAGLLAVVNGLLAAAAGGIAIPLEDGSGVLMVGPLVWAAVLFLGTLLSASALQVAGRILGGAGTFEGSLLVTVWINAVALAIEIATLMVGLVSMSLALVLFVLGLIALLWSLINFVRVLHGFGGILRSFLAILLAGFGTLIGVSFLLTLALSLGAPTDV